MKKIALLLILLSSFGFANAKVSDETVISEVRRIISQDIASALKRHDVNFLKESGFIIEHESYDSITLYHKYAPWYLISYGLKEIESLSNKWPLRRLIYYIPSEDKNDPKNQIIIYALPRFEHEYKKLIAYTLCTVIAGIIVGRYIIGPDSYSMPTVLSPNIPKKPAPKPPPIPPTNLGPLSDTEFECKGGSRPRRNSNFVADIKKRGGRALLLTKKQKQKREERIKQRQAAFEERKRKEQEESDGEKRYVSDSEILEATAKVIARRASLAPSSDENPDHDDDGYWDD